MTTLRPVGILLIAVAWLLLAALPGAHLAAQHVSEGVRCRPVTERAGELGCWIDPPVTRLIQTGVEHCRIPDVGTYFRPGKYFKL